MSIASSVLLTEEFLFLAVTSRWSKICVFVCIEFLANSMIYNCGMKERSKLDKIWYRYQAGYSEAKYGHFFLFLKRIRII